MARSPTQKSPLADLGDRYRLAIARSPLPRSVLKTAIYRRATVYCSVHLLGNLAASDYLSSINQPGILLISNEIQCQAKKSEDFPIQKFSDYSNSILPRHPKRL